MKRILIIILLLITVQTSAMSKPAATDTLTVIEDGMFGYNYKNESESKRLDRIETQLYGEKRKGSVQKRLQDIQNDTGFVSAEEQQQAVQAQQKQAPAPKADEPDLTAKEDASVEYPLVDRMEQDIFNTTYKNENIYKRLTRLEEKVFNKASTEPLNSRVDKLASIIAPSRSRTVSKENLNYSKEDMNAYYSNSGLEPVNNQSMPFQLAAIEQDLLKSDFMNENNSRRLSRLEKKMFNRTFANDTDITRLQRIMVAYDAKKNSYKYENNRRMQNIAAASQLGGILLMILAILL